MANASFQWVTTGQGFNYFSHKIVSGKKNKLKKQKLNKRRETAADITFSTADVMEKNVFSISEHFYDYYYQGPKATTFTILYFWYFIPLVLAHPIHMESPLPFMGLRCFSYRPHQTECLHANSPRSTTFARYLNRFCHPVITHITFVPYETCSR